MESKKVMRIASFILVILLALTLPFMILSMERHSEPYEKIVKIGNKKVYVEVADTQEERAQGLMGRKNMSENHGMLFIFMDEAQHAFWMKNTYIPLDIIFLGENMEVKDIKRNFEPCLSSNCRVFTPRNSIIYVLEVNAGFVDKYGVDYGTFMKII